MKIKKIFKRIPFIIIPIGFIFSFGIIFHFISKNSLNVSPVYEQITTDSDLPVRLKIPSISINAAVNYVGLTPEGEMDVPKNPPDVAWFDIGPRPGENGSAVIDGHSGWKNGKMKKEHQLLLLYVNLKIMIQIRMLHLFLIQMTEKHT